MMYQMLGWVKNGHVPLSKRIMTEAMKRFEGKRVIVSIEEFEPEASRQQRAYYFAAVVEPIREISGYQSKYDTHEELKKACNAIESHDLLTGEVTIIGGSTKRMKKLDFAAFIQRVIDLGRYVGARIYSPEDYYEMISAKHNEPTTTMPEEEGT